MAISVNPPRKRRGAKNAQVMIPAAIARAPEVLTVDEEVLNGEAVESFAKAVGGRDQLTEVLSIAETAPDVERVVNLLLDPRMTHIPLKRLCNQAGLTVADLFAAYKKALITKAHVQASQIIAAKLPPIVEDVMTMARSEPTVERQKLALELGQLTQQKGGLTITQNQQTVTQATLATHSSGALEQLQQAVGELLFNPARRRAQSPPQE